MDLDSLKARLKSYVDRPGALWDEADGAAGRARARIDRSAALPRLVGICADIFEEKPAPPWNLTSLAPAPLSLADKRGIR
jgi:hypothetical protein